MVMCLDTLDCRYQNREKSRFCASCGIPVRGALLQGRYEVQSLLTKNRSTVTLQGNDLHQEIPVTIRALLPNETSDKEREDFLQDAELAMMLSKQVHEPGSVRVIDYGEDGSLVFLVKTDMDEEITEKHPSRPRMTVRVEHESYDYALPSTHTAYENDGDVLTELRPVMPSLAHDDNAENAATAKLHLATPIPARRNDWLADGDRAYELGNYEEALVAYEEAIAEGNDTVEVWSGKGATLLQLGHAGEALPAYDYALSRKPGDPDLWNSRASVLHELRRYDEEMQCYDQALAIDPNYIFAWSGRGMTLVEQNHPEEALLAFDRALVLDATQGIIWQAMSDTLYSLQRYDEALIAIDRALELEPGNAMMWDVKGNILRRLKKPEEALALHEYATQLTPENAIAWFDKANDLRDMQCFGDALAD